jgi:hypothetical protein
MIIYNITFNVENDIKPEWLDFMQREMIPLMLKSRLLHSAVLSELLIDEPQGTSYALQFRSDNAGNLKKFQDRELQPILSAMHRKYGDKVVYFPTEMKIIKSFDKE